MGLPIAHDFEQNHAMEDRAGQTNTIRDFVRWATTLPQSVAVYFVCLVLIGGLSFYAGTLRPKKPIVTAPPPASAPRN
jgi:hypothetical protein|nr:hypothetical protein [Bradyrhizobium sp.]